MKLLCWWGKENASFFSRSVVFRVEETASTSNRTPTTSGRCAHLQGWSRRGTNSWNCAGYRRSWCGVGQGEGGEEETSLLLELFISDDRWWRIVNRWWNSSASEVVCWRREAEILKLGFCFCIRFDKSQADNQHTTQQYWTHSEMYFSEEKQN